jgi:mRNA interferase RelE/StbE
MFEVRVLPPALRQINSLPPKAQPALWELLGVVATNPFRLGVPLQRELAGLFSARRGPYRVIYAVEMGSRLVVVHRIQHRSDVYRPR